ncbi:Pirin [Plesiocystis pacifica SIR-1]|uniref:Pirin n=1 Tax=Plesiocystis pacifica SIR-1 TaxID=391625 RepID=A6GFF9_9BACT|nr:Pirin [Plesiocystis pacifica SIR-1]
MPPPARGQAEGGEGAGEAQAVAMATVLERFAARPTTDGAGATLRRVFPHPQLRNLDPFVLLDDFDVRRPAGFPTHPHRGFEAFTYMIAGAFHHKDSMGNDSVIGPGGTQRFTSGRGARHSEMPATDGSNRGLQLWVNLPRRLKKMAPSYAGIDGASMPAPVEGAGHVLREVVGSRSPVELQTEVQYFDVDLLADARFDHAIPSGHNALIYVLDGEVELLGERLGEGEVLLPTPGRVQIAARSASRILWLSGAPHGEAIVHRGPFVD